MNIMQLTDSLAANPDIVSKILNSLGYDRIQFNSVKKQFRFARAEGNNPTSVILNLDSLKFFCFSTNEKGDLYTLIMDKLGLPFPKALKYVAKISGFDTKEFSSDIKLPFNGFFRNLKRQIEEPETAMETYSESILNNYVKSPNMMFFNDGISFQAQSDYDIGYDLATNRITVPIRTFRGELCGIMGRLNDTQCGHEERWFPIIPCSRSLTLFGYCKNYKFIQEKSFCIVGESEKFPMQAASFGCNLALATSGCHISDIQAKYLKAMMTKYIIVAYDEGLEEEFVREQASKLKIDNCIMRNKVGYVWDETNELLLKGRKQSITDLGKDKFAEAINKKVRWL